MGNINKSVPLFLILLMAASVVVMAKPATAQSIPKPYVPEFNLQYVSSSYKIIITDPYTGANVTNIYLNNTIEVVINNQPFSQTSANDNSLYYQVAEKGHYSDEWKESAIYPASNSQYTIVDIGFASDNGSSSSFQIQDNIPNGGQVDITIIAIIGHYTTVPRYIGEFPYGTTQVQNGTSSGWNTPLAIRIPDGSVSTSSSNPPTNPTITSTQPTPSTIPSSTPTSTRTATPTVPELSWLAILPLFLFVFFIAVIIRHRKNIKSNPVTFSQISERR